MARQRIIDDLPDFAQRVTRRDAFLKVHTAEKRACRRARSPHDPTTEATEIVNHLPQAAIRSGFFNRLLDRTIEPITGKMMSGGICFILHGNMGTGTMKSTTQFRVGKPKDVAALAIPGPCFSFNRSKAMASIVELPTEDCGDDTRRAALNGKALACAKALPPK